MVVIVIVVVIDDPRTYRPKEAFGFKPTPRFVLLPIISQYQHEDFFAITSTTTITITSKTSPFEGLSDLQPPALPEDSYVAPVNLFLSHQRDTEPLDHALQAFRKDFARHEARDHQVRAFSAAVKIAGVH